MRTPLAISSRSTRRRDTPPVIPTAIAGALVLLAVVVLLWQALRVYNGVPGRDYATVYVSTPQVGNLLTHDQVRVAGARVGQVIGRDVGTDGRPRVELQIEPGTELSADTRVAVRGAGLLGARYIELIPGQEATDLADGATIKGNDDAYAFGLPETLDTFDRETRGALGSMIGGLGQGLLGHGEQLNDGIHAAGTRAEKFGIAAAEIMRRDGAVGRLLPALESAVAPLDANRKQLSALTTAAADAIEPFVDRREQTRATLDEAGPALASMRTGLAAGTGLLTSVRAAASAAHGTLPKAPAGLRSLSRMLADSKVPLQRADALLRAAGPAVPGVLRITAALNPVLAPLEKAIDDLTPSLGHVARYGCDIVNFGQTMRSMTGYTQPGEGAHGPLQAFRLQIVAPLSTDVVGVKDATGTSIREGIVAPCTYLAKPYPQFVGGAR